MDIKSLNEIIEDSLVSCLNEINGYKVEDSTLMRYDVMKLIGFNVNVTKFILVDGLPHNGKYLDDLQIDSRLKFFKQIKYFQRGHERDFYCSIKDEKWLKFSI